MVDAIKTQESVAVIGAGAMGAGIAQVAAIAGHTVYLYDLDQQAVEQGLAGIDGSLAKAVERGKLTATDAQASRDRIQPITELAALAEASLCIEAVVENLDVKQTLFARLESLLAESAILATNTSSLSVTAIGARLDRPQRLVGMHFFNPAPVMKLVEVVSGISTAPEVAETVFATATRWGKTAVHARNVPGFIVNRVARPFYYEAFRAWQEGVATAEMIDALLTQCAGFRMGPLALTDLIGQDINYTAAKSIFDAYAGDVRFAPSLIQKDLLDSGRLGRKSKQGVYAYPAGAPAAQWAAQAETETSTNSDMKVTPYPGIARPLFERLRDRGFTLQEDPALGHACLQYAGMQLALTDGRLSSTRSHESGFSTVQFDLTDFTQGQHIAIAPDPRIDTQALNKLIGLLQAADFSVGVIGDHAGMIVMRTVVSLANVACDAVRDQVASAEGVDQAMRFGVNYPHGPLQWADSLGARLCQVILNNIAETCGEPRYRPSTYMLQQNQLGRPLAEA